jgi:hypothetical protein
VPGCATELAVRSGPEAGLLLHPDGVPDRPVLRGPQLVTRSAAGGKILTGFQKLRGTEQASNVVGAERRRCAGQGISFGKALGTRFEV